jgi:hypothetical protein
LGWCITSCGFLRLKNNLFFNQTIKYVFFLIIRDCLPKFGQVFDPTLEETRRFGREKFVEPLLELSVVVERNSAQMLERAEEVVIRWGKIRRVGRMWSFLLDCFLQRAQLLTIAFKQ